ncbi:toll/interleukin-1 receptor domain-containing protein [Pseudomonas sp. NPDC089392]|uniref:toll/interleukin-1 receptor domain-containing protein n=1 Tax=Pseudomonas sp. NPDC089392 TaxID=3364459 RepID=UPI00381C0DC2
MQQRTPAPRPAHDDKDTRQQRCRACASWRAPMIFDIDKLLTMEEPVPEGDRIFHYEVFISHRRFDLPTLFVQTISELGVRVSWDNDFDLRDRRIIHAVSQAMKSSRYILLYVSDQYSDSLWCKAEYLSAIQFEKRFSCSRVLLVLESARATCNIPITLTSHLMFTADDKGMANLAAYVIAENLRSTCDPMLLNACESSKRLLGLDTSLLKLPEQMNILQQRLEYWIEVGGIPQSATELDQRTRDVMNLMGSQFTELESILRDVQRCVLRSTINFVPTEDHSEATLKHLVTIAELVVISFKLPLTCDDSVATAEWLYDLILVPLLLPIISDSTRRRALIAYYDICDQLNRTPERAFVPIYRTVAEAVAFHPGNVDSIINHALVQLLLVGEQK